MNAKLTAEQARAIRFMRNKEGIVKTDAAVSAAIRELLSTEFVAVGITVAGYEALANYDREHGEEANRDRIASNMSRAARLQEAQNAARTLSEAGGRSDG